MDKEVILSICVACYNQWHYIKECLDSIVKYEFLEQLEIVIIDDKSTDNSEDIIKKWIKNNPNISTAYSRNAENSWPWYTYNQAISMAQWEYISFMDADDYFIQSSLQDKILYSKKHAVDIVYGNWSFLRNQELQTLPIHASIDPILSLKDSTLLYQTITSRVPMLSLSSSLIKKSFLSKIWGFDEHKLAINDWILNIKMMRVLSEKDSSFWYDKRCVFAYRIHDNNISKNPWKQYSSFDYIINTYCPQQYHNQLYKDILFVTAIRYKMIGDMKNTIIYINKLKTYISSRLMVIVAYIVAYIPLYILKKTESSLRNIKQYFKWKLF